MNDKANTATPANATPSELESEFRDGIPSAVTQPHAETVGDYFKTALPRILRPDHYQYQLGAWAKMTAHLLSSLAITRELHCAFIWSASPEGDAFWRAVAQREAR